MENKDKIVILCNHFSDFIAGEGFSIGDVLSSYQILITAALEQVDPKERRNRVLMEFIRNLIQISLEKHIEEVTNQ